MIAVVLLGLASGPAWASPSWPTDDQWHAVTVFSGAGSYVDAVLLSGNPHGDVYATPPSDSRDLVGGTDYSGAGPYPTAYWYFDGENIMFRIRVDGSPYNDPFVWSALLNTDADNDTDFALQLDISSSANQVEMAVAVSGGPANGWDVLLADEPHVPPGTGDPSTDFYRWMSATAIDGSDFSGPDDEDYFLDFAFPYATFLSVTGQNPGDPFSVAFTTSSSHVTPNKDLPDYTVWSDPITVPEPSSAALLSLGLLTIAWRKVRRGADPSAGA